MREPEQRCQNCGGGQKDGDAHPLAHRRAPRDSRCWLCRRIFISASSRINGRMTAPIVICDKATWALEI